MKMLYAKRTYKVKIRIGSTTLFELILEESMKSIKIFKMIRNKTLIFFLLILSACGKQAGEDEQQKHRR